VSDIVVLSSLWGLETAFLISDSPSSLVYRAQRKSRSVIVKILKPEGLHEIPGMDFLRWRDGRAAIKFIDRHGHAFLLEDGGAQTLFDRYATSGDQGATSEFRTLIDNLHSPSNSPAPASLVPLEAHFGALFVRAESGTPPEHAHLLGWAADLARGLLISQENIRPLHGDIHHRNVVSPDGASWKAIDPQGLIGDPAYDYANIFGNPDGEPGKVLDADRCMFLADSFSHSTEGFESNRGLSAVKLMKYAAVHSALSASWSL
jgi:streptomycin 6-kinase